MSIPTLNPTDMADLIKHVAIKLNEPVMIVGRLGSAKSAITNQVARDLNNKAALDALLGETNTFDGCVICDIRLGQYESVDLRGFPGVNKATGFTVWHAPSTMPFVGNDDFPDDKIILLFLDELTSAQPSVFAIGYQLINERRVGEHFLKPNVRIVAAGNREDDKGVVNRMPMPLCNRMTWAEMIIDHHGWSEWAQSVGIHPIIIAYVNFKPMNLMTYDPQKAEKVVATLRTWEKAAKYFVDTMPDSIKWTAIKGVIGEGNATELLAFQNVWLKVTPIKSIIADPEGVPVPEKADMRFATAVSVSGAINVKNADALYTFLKRMPAEMVVLALQLATKRDQSLYKTAMFIDFTKKYRSVFSL